MRLYASFFRILLRARFQPRVGFLDQTSLQRRVSPRALDVFAHMNNAAYFEEMDLARIDHAARSGFAWECYRREWGLVVAVERLRFRRGLKLFEPFSVQTRVLGWEGKYRYLRQEFTARGNLVAEGLVKEALITVKRSDGLTFDAALRAANIGEASPPIPERVRSLLESGDSLDAQVG